MREKLKEEYKKSKLNKKSKYNNYDINRMKKTLMNIFNKTVEKINTRFSDLHNKFGNQNKDF